MTDIALKKNYAKYVSLNVLGMVGLSCYILADTFFISDALGSLGLAALNFAIPIFSIINGIGLMCGMGGGAKYTIFRSQGESSSENIIFTHSIFIGVIIGLTLSLIGLLFSSPISSLLGADHTTLNITNIYLKTVLCFAPFFILNNTLLAFIRNDNNPNLSMVAMLTGSISNIFLDYIFIYPLRLGMFGAALATGLSPIISISILAFHFLLHKNHLKLQKCKPIFSYITSILFLGISAFITELSSGVVLITFNLVILQLEGNIGVAAYGIIANLALVIIAIFTGISQGIQPLLSKAYGLQENEKVKLLLKYSVTTSLVFSCIVYVVSLINSEFLISIFNSEQNLRLHDLALTGIKIYFSGFFFAGFNIIITTFFSAIDSPKQSFMISIVRGFIAIVPIVFILSMIFKMNGVWFSFTVTEIITTALAVSFLLCYYKPNLK